MGIVAPNGGEAAVAEAAGSAGDFNVNQSTPHAPRVGGESDGLASPLLSSADAKRVFDGSRLLRAGGVRGGSAAVADGGQDWAPLGTSASAAEAALALPHVTNPLYAQQQAALQQRAAAAALRSAASPAPATGALALDQHALPGAAAADGGAAPSAASAGGVADMRFYGGGGPPPNSRALGIGNPAYRALKSEFSAYTASPESAVGASLKKAARRAGLPRPQQGGAGDADNDGDSSDGSDGERRRVAAYRAAAPEPTAPAVPAASETATAEAAAAEGARGGDAELRSPAAVRTPKPASVAAYRSPAAARVLSSTGSFRRGADAAAPPGQSPGRTTNGDPR